MKNRHTKPINNIPTSKTNATTESQIFLYHWAAYFGILFKLLTEDGRQFISKFFVAVYSTLGATNITTTEYHSQTNGQAEHSTEVLYLD